MRHSLDHYVHETLAGLREEGARSAERSRQATSQIDALARRISELEKELDRIKQLGQRAFYAGLTVVLVLANADPKKAAEFVSQVIEGLK